MPKEALTFTVCDTLILFGSDIVTSQSRSCTEYLIPTKSVIVLY